MHVVSIVRPDRCYLTTRLYTNLLVNSFRHLGFNNLLKHCVYCSKKCIKCLKKIFEEINYNCNILKLLLLVPCVLRKYRNGVKIKYVFKLSCQLKNTMLHDNVRHCTTYLITEKKSSGFV